MFANSSASRNFRFEWDEAKNRLNIRKHGFDFAEAEEMFRGFFLVRPDHA
jgi:uncharacterized DUF497 family protein